jgi:hypothetical protein
VEAGGDAGGGYMLKKSAIAADRIGAEGLTHIRIEVHTKQHGLESVQNKRASQ